jgi:transposase
MELTLEQYDKIKHVLPVQRGNVEIDNVMLLNALLYITENGCKWRALPEHFGKWNTVYRRVSRWAKAGVIQNLFETMQRERILAIGVDFIALDSTSTKVHPNGTGAEKKMANNPSVNRAVDGRPRFICLPLMIERP